MRILPRLLQRWLFRYRLPAGRHSDDRGPADVLRVALLRRGVMHMMMPVMRRMMVGVSLA
jgi:hypothetical protein